MMNKGFTLIEVLVAVAVLAVLVVLAVPSFASLINRERVGSATDGFVRALEQAKAHAIQTGVRTQLLINISNSTLKKCGEDNVVKDVAWAIVEEGKDEAGICLTKADFDKRFGGTTLQPVAATTLVMTPLGIANNNAKVSFTFSSKEKSKVVDIYPGGSIKLQQCRDSNGVAVLDC